ncbi:hypothetical protein GOY11_33495, partial [Pseudomonas aeruginosa]|nr:hypothetical protein [Pseudomonas aeruginosa]
MFGAIAGGIASALAGGAMSTLSLGDRHTHSDTSTGDVLHSGHHAVSIVHACINSGIQRSTVPNPGECVAQIAAGA